MPFNKYAMISFVMQKQHTGDNIENQIRGQKVSFKLIAMIRMRKSFRAILEDKWREHGIHFKKSSVSMKFKFSALFRCQCHSLKQEIQRRKISEAGGKKFGFRYINLDTCKQAGHP